jgi:FkbM family methyltransferase
MRIVVKFILNALVSVVYYGAYKIYKGVSYLSPKYSRILWFKSKLSGVNNDIIDVIHKDLLKNEIKMKFASSNLIGDLRAYSFSVKEPETLSWIEQCPDGVFFDIGANIGLYTIYYGLVKHSKIYAFECAAFNLPGLVKNINLNSMAYKVNIISTPLGDKQGFESLYLCGMDEGLAGHVFASDCDESGDKHNYEYSSSLLGMSLDYMFTSGLISDIPVNIKIDVDGTEGQIIAGAIQTLAHPDCKNILIEVNESVKSVSDKINHQLISCGFILKSKVYKKHNADKNEFGNYSYVSNQIWSKEQKN